jgi:glycosyltransferase involved in cell wall biosynthesis
MNKKILFIIHALGYGGAGKMIVYLANHMSEIGYDVTIYVQEQKGQHYELGEGVEVVQETKFFTNYYTRHFQQIFQLRRRVKEINPDLVISFQTNQNALAVLATRGRKIPVIVSERGDPYQYNNIVAKLKTFVINQAEGGVFQTKRAMEYYGKGLQKRSRVIYNPNTVPALERPEWKNRRNEIVFVARFDIQQKRQDLMIKAFAQIAKRIPDYKLGFYGAGNDEAIIRNLASELGVENQVIFHGLTQNVPEAIKDAKLFVLTSDYEGMPNALIEAMSIGLPCISTDCSPGGAAELISNNKNGIIVPCGDVDCLAGKILELVKNPERANLYGEKAQEVVQLLHPNKIYHQWEEYIQLLIGDTQNYENI